MTYEDGEMRQDAWSKRTWQASPEELAERRELEEKLKPVRFSPEEAAAKEREVLEQRAHNMLTEEKNNDIIKLGINMFDTSDPLYVESFSIEEEEGFKDVFLHGSSSSVQIKKEGKLVNLSPTEFVDELYKRGYNGEDIRLASCETGKGDNSFAQQVSKIIGGKVKAADSDVYYAPNEGVLFVGDPLRNTGKWRIFENGVEIDD